MKYSVANGYNVACCSFDVENMERILSKILQTVEKKAEMVEKLQFILVSSQKSILLMRFCALQVSLLLFYSVCPFLFFER